MVFRLTPAGLSLIIALSLSSTVALMPPALSAAEPGASGKGKLEELTLSDLRDYGIGLDVIRQETINIYREAVRSTVGVDEGPEVARLESIPIDVSGRKLLPARREWLVYYLTSMEPAIRLLGEEVRLEESGAARVIVPETLKAEAEPLWRSWETDVKAMNRHLDELVPLFDDPARNSEKIAAAAVQIFTDIGKLESTRQKTYMMVREAERRGAGKIMVQE